VSKNRVLEQQIAVFGEGGSGKTVLVSSFYGAAQEPDFVRNSRFHVVADGQSQGHRLHQNYLEMRDEGQPPIATRFASTSYSFSIKLRAELEVEAKSAKSAKFQALRLVWHDYPGEWFEQGVSGPEESERRVETFRSLLGSDVAFLLVDGQRLSDHAGDEERYLRSLFTNFRNSLLSVRDDLLSNGKPLVDFPRIWVLALSKSDLLPNWDVITFRDLLIRKAADEIDNLRSVLAGFVADGQLLSLGEDFLLLSSAKFEPQKIEVSRRVGLDLVLPLAAVLPLQYHLRWANTTKVSTEVLKSLVDSLGGISALLGMIKKVPLPLKVLKGPLGGILSLALPPIADLATQLPRKKVEELVANASSRHDYIGAVRADFINDLNDGIEKQVFFRSLA